MLEQGLSEANAASSCETLRGGKMVISFVSRETGCRACGLCVAGRSARFSWNSCEIQVEASSYGNDLYCSWWTETPAVLHLGR